MDAARCTLSIQLQLNLERPAHAGIQYSSLLPTRDTYSCFLTGAAADNHTSFYHAQKSVHFIYKFTDIAVPTQPTIYSYA